MNEARVSAKVREEFTARGAVCWKVSDRFHASRPDLLIVCSSITGYIEMKIWPEVPTTLQEHTLSELTAQGAPTWLCQYKKKIKTYRLTHLNTGMVQEFNDHRGMVTWVLEHLSSNIRPSASNL